MAKAAILVALRIWLEFAQLLRNAVSVHAE